MSLVEARIKSNEKKLRDALNDKRTPNDPEVAKLRRKLRDDLCDLIRIRREDDESLVEKLWRLCFHKRIDEYRKQITATPAGSQQRKLVSEFRQFLGEATQFFDDFGQSLQKPCITYRVFLCLGDIARYREMVADSDEKRWRESIDWYKRASSKCPQAGGAQNQLAVIASYQGKALVSIYRYERALACSNPFEASRENLRQVLVQASKLDENKDRESSSNLETVLMQACKLQAYLILPENGGIDNITAEESLATLKQGLKELVQRHQLRSEVTSALLLSFMFTFTHSLSGKSSQDSKEFSIRVLRLIGFDLVTQASSDVTNRSAEDVRMRNKEATMLATKALFPVCLLVFFFRTHGLQLMDESLKSSFDLLEVTLSEVPLDSSEANDQVFDEDEVEVLGFLPLGLMEANEQVNMNDLIVVPPTFEHRAIRVRRFVRELVENDLKKFSADGILISTTVLTPAAREDDEEEEILFKPKFAAPSENVEHSPSAYPMSQGLFSFTPTMWTGLLPPPHLPTQPGPNPALFPTEQTEKPSNWPSNGWGSDKQPSGSDCIQDSNTASKLVSPPPGFHQ